MKDTTRVVFSPLVFPCRFGLLRNSRAIISRSSRSSVRRNVAPLGRVSHRLRSDRASSTGRAKRTLASFDSMRSRVCCSIYCLLVVGRSCAGRKGREAPEEHGQGATIRRRVPAGAGAQTKGASGRAGRPVAKPQKPQQQQEQHRHEQQQQQQSFRAVFECVAERFLSAASDKRGSHNTCGVPTVPVVQDLSTAAVLCFRFFRSVVFSGRSEDGHGFHFFSERGWQVKICSGKQPRAKSNAGSSCRGQWGCACYLFDWSPSSRRALSLALGGVGTSGWSTAVGATRYFWSFRRSMK